MKFNGNRMTNIDWINLSNVLGLNDAQRYLFIVLPNIADTNGCFESDPRVICHLTSTKITDLEQLFKLMVSEELLENYQVGGKWYWYLTRFLEMQKLRTKAKIPCPPWLTWQPEKGQISQGCYQDTRKLLPTTTTLAIDNKFTENHPRVEESVSRGECECEMIKDVQCNNVPDSANALNDKQQLEQALQDVFSGEKAIKLNPEYSKQVHKQQILMALKCNPKYKLNNVWQRFDIMPEGDDWKVYERWQNETVPS